MPETATEIPFRDTFGRPMRDLRLSVTDRCNFRCVYCMPKEKFGTHFSFLPPASLLTFDEIERLVRVFVSLGIRKVRITGGEPLLRPRIEELVARIRRVAPGVDLAMTTNGFLLAKKARALREAGLDRVTVSLDSLDPRTFRRLSGTNLLPDLIVRGIDAAREVGFEVKVNMVVIRGENDADILPMARFFREKGVTLRFIEFMDVGTANDWNLERVVPAREILERISREMPLEPIHPEYFGEVAKRYRYVGSDVEIGFVTSVTQAFCSSCTRIRLTADGKLVTCLFAETGEDVRALLRSGASEEELVAKIREVWERRADHYSEIRLANTKKDRAKVEMFYVGG